MRLLCPVVLVLALVGCREPPKQESVPVMPPAPAEAKGEAKEEAKADAKSSRRPIKVEPTYEAQLGRLDERIVGYTKSAERKGNSSLAWGRLAQLYLTRARLSGSYDDYAKAEEILVKAFEVAPKGKYGPFMVRARLNYTLHRLDRAEADFEMATKAPTRDRKELAARAQFSSNLAFQRGRYEQALKGLTAAVEATPTLSTLSSLALYRWKAASFDEAEALYRRALEVRRSKEEAEPVAWVHLQLGLMDLDRGRYDEALAHYRQGEALIAGYWLIDEHIAEILTLQGRTDEAKAMYASIIERTNNPEFMDAMAGIHAEAGEQDQAKQWVAKARARYEEQLARFPEAAYGHALEHFLEFGEDLKQVVELAENNHTLRPNATAKTLLAQAYLKAGRVDDAKTIIEQALATPMRSADLHGTAAEIYAAAGDEKTAGAQRNKARAINPKFEAG